MLKRRYMDVLEHQRWADYDTILGNVRTSGKQTVAQALRVAMNAWLEEKGPRPTLDLLIAALRCSGTDVPICACRAISIVAPFAENPTEFVLTASVRATAPARGWMMRFVSPEIGHAFRALVEAGLVDSAARVREWACEGVDHGEFRDLIGHLRDTELHDKSGKVRVAAGDAAMLLERGYCVRWEADRRGWTVFVRKNARSGTSLFIHRSFTNHLGWDAVDAMIRADPGNPALEEP